jgi:hypothetical protein
MDPDIRLIDISTVPDDALPPLAQCLTEKWSSPHLPISNGVVRQEHTPLEKHLRQVPQAELVAEVPQGHEADHIGGKLQPIDGCPCTFIEDTLTIAAANATIAQFRLIRALSGRSRLTMWAHHVLILLSEVRVSMLCERK